MKLFQFTLMLFIGLSLVDANAQTTDSWIQFPDFSGEGRTGSISFVINNKAYVGTGINPSGTRLKDFWEFNPQTGLWTQKADAGGIGRNEAAAFALGSRGYMGTGIIAFNTFVNDFWEYDPASDLWTPRQSVGLWGRARSLSFVLKGKGYFTLGVRAGGNGYIYDETTWEYNSTSNLWTQRSSFPGVLREEGTSFVINGLGYITGGVGLLQPPGVLYIRDTWSYHPVTDIWTQKGATYPPGYDPLIYTMEAFTVGAKAYILAQSSTSHQTFEYNPSSDVYVMKAAAPTPTTKSTSFSMSSLGYYATGETGNKFYRYLSDELRMSGPELVCANNSSFQLNFVQSGASITWSHSSNLNAISGQGTATFTVAGNSIGPGFVRADVTHGGSSYFQQRNFWVGAYGSSNYPVTGPSSACSNTMVFYSTNTLVGATNITWSWPPDWTFVSGQGTTNLALITGSTSGPVLVRVDNVCGPAGSPGMQFTQVNYCGGFAMQVSPNPASDILTVSLVDSESSSEFTQKIDDGGVDIKLYNSSMKEVVSCKSLSRSTELIVSHLPEGKYYVNAAYKSSKIQKQIQIKR
jgi:hypothetical protein